MVIEPLTKAHNYKRFDCTEEWMVDEVDVEAASDMNVFLQRHAIDQMKRGVSFTYILRDERSDEPLRALAYYSTSVGHLKSEDIPRVVSPRMTIPVFMLLRLAVDKDFQRKGYGAKLLIHVLVQGVNLAIQTGIHALVLEPLNKRVRAFYEKFGFCAMPGDPERMYVRIRDIDSWLKQRGKES